MICLTLALGCGRKGDPIPHPRAAPEASVIRWAELRSLELRIPEKDTKGTPLVGIERVRVYYLPAGVSQPSAQEVVARGEVVLERRSPHLPKPGQWMTLDMKHFVRSAGWIVVVPARVGNVSGPPSNVLFWLNPAI